MGEPFVEPGRFFSPRERYPREAMLPGDVPRVHEVQGLALLHMVRLLLRRAPAEPEVHSSVRVDCRGEVKLRLKALSNISFIVPCCLFVRHFPAVRLVVIFAEDNCSVDEADSRGLFAARGAGGGCLFNGHGMVHSLDSLDPVSLRLPCAVTEK